MTEKINILKAVFNESLKTALNNITPEQIDEILNNRDSTEFSKVWMKIYQVIEETEDKISDIRRKIFMSAFRTRGSSDLPAYISDDFALTISIRFHRVS